MIQEHETMIGEVWLGGTHVVEVFDGDEGAPGIDEEAVVLLQR